MKKKISLLMVMVLVISLLLPAFAAADDSGLIALDETNFPDANFRAYLTKSFDGDGDGKLDPSAVTEIRCSDLKISSLKGIEYFTALTGLYCGINPLNTLDISKNTALKVLSCQANRLKSLDISKNTALKVLSCKYNFLTTLDVSSSLTLNNAAVNGKKTADNLLNTVTYTVGSAEVLSLDANVTLVCNASQAGHLFPVNFTGFAEYDGGLFFVSGGDVVTSANGLVNDPNNTADWYYCSKGQVQLQYSGMAEYDGEWFWLEKGKLNTGRRGIVSYDGGRFIIAAGRLLKEANGMIQDPNTGIFYYVAGGQVQNYRGLALYDGAWFYIWDGVFQSDAEGYVEYNGGVFYVVGGQVVSQIS